MTQHSAPLGQQGQWEQTATLRALRELTDVSRLVGPTVARRAGLSSTELTALENAVDTPLGLGEMARRLGVTSAAASQIVDRLVERAHVERRPDPQDGRRVLVQVTESGQAEVIGHLMPMFQALAALDAGLSDEERVVVERYLTGAVAALRTVL